MPDGTDWLMQPVDAGYCLYESLLEGKFTLVDMVRMNNAIATKLENQRRLTPRH